MLVLTRKQKEVIRIGDNVTITILRIKGQSVRIGIDAPNDIRVVRGELTTFSDDAVTTSEPTRRADAAEFDLPSSTRSARRPARPSQPNRPSSRTSKASSNCRANSLEILTEAAKKVRQRSTEKKVEPSVSDDEAALAAGRVPITERIDLAMLSPQKRQGFSQN